MCGKQEILKEDILFYFDYLYYECYFNIISSSVVHLILTAMDRIAVANLCKLINEDILLICG